MKRIVLSLFVAAAVITGCHKPGIKPDEARISGTISPAVSGYLNITAGPVLDSAKINKSGKFSITIPLTGTSKAILFFSNRLTEVYLEPGKEVSLTINSTLFPDKISYGGELGPVNHYLTLSRKLDQQNSLTPAELFSKEPEQFVQYTDSVKQLKIKLLDEYEAKYKEIDSGFVSRTRLEIEFSWADQHLLYPWKYQMLKGTQPAIPAGYHIDYLTRLNLNTSSNLNSPVYKVFIQNYLDYRQSAYLNEHPNTAKLIFPESVARFRVIHEEFTNRDVLEYLLFTAMNDHLANFGTTRVESFLTDFRVTCRNQDYVKTIAAMVANMEKVGMGKPAPDFTAYTPDGKKVNISDFFGQLLYIGFWASWSDWSLQEIPYFEQLRRDFEGKPVKFILISLDFEKDKNRWAAIIKMNNFGSIQLIQDPKSNVLKDNYYLNDFPRYFLIGKDGKIISVYAPRPTENVAETLTRIITAN
ncbi:MAG: TlpA disulfide reductase family protein [Bacteroidia bacterium]|nr:TlpA disulfide reductase family protein [Bacteroidia bacterium]